MKRQRTLWEKIIITIKDVLTVVGVGSFILDFANGYGFTTFTIKIVLLGICLWIFFKANEIVSNEINREIFDEKFNSIAEERSCIRNVLNYKDYQSKNNIRVGIDEDFNVFISMSNCFVVRISREKFLGLNDEHKIEEFDQYIADYLNNSLNKNLSKNVTETVLETVISNYLNKLI